MHQNVHRHCINVLHILGEPTATDTEVIAAWLEFIEALESSEGYDSREYWGEHYNAFQELYEAAMRGVWLEEA